jgi:hypothetical protein
MVCPLYISEISPTHLRGRLVTVFQFAITVGIMIALFNNFGLHQWAASISDSVAEGSFTKWFVVDETWRVMFASELIPGLIFLVLAFMLPESPRWLVNAGRHEKARQVLQRIFRNGADDEFESIKDTLAAEQADEKRFIDVLHPRYRKPLVIAMLLAAFAQFSGINVVFYYGTSMLENRRVQVRRRAERHGGHRLLQHDLHRRRHEMGGQAGPPAAAPGRHHRRHRLPGRDRRQLQQRGQHPVDRPDVRLRRLLRVLARADQVHLRLRDLPHQHPLARDVDRHPHDVGDRHLVGQFTPALREGIGPSGTFFLFACILVPQIFMVWKWMPETAGRSLEEIERTYQ